MKGTTKWKRISRVRPGDVIRVWGGEWRKVRSVGCGPEFGVWFADAPLGSEWTNLASEYNQRRQGQPNGFVVWGCVEVEA